MFEEAWSGEAKGVAHAEEFQRTAFYAILTLGLPAAGPAHVGYAVPQHRARFFKPSANCRVPRFGLLQPLEWLPVVY